MRKMALFVISWNNVRQKLNDNLVFFSLSSVVQFLVVEIKPFFIEKLGLLLGV